MTPVGRLASALLLYAALFLSAATSEPAADQAPQPSPVVGHADVDDVAAPPATRITWASPAARPARLRFDTDPHRLRAHPRPPATATRLRPSAWRLRRRPGSHAPRMGDDQPSPAAAA